jgi:hypothetical protein
LEKDHEYIIKLNKKHIFTGDVTIEVKEDKSFGNNLLISYVFNTAFVDIKR